MEVLRTSTPSASSFR